MSDKTEQKTTKGTLTLSSSKLTLGAKAPASPAGKTSGAGVHVQVRKKRRAFVPSESAGNSKKKTFVKKEETLPGGLTKGEQDTRLRALHQAAEDRKVQEEQEVIKREQDEEERKKAVLADNERLKSELEAKKAEEPEVVSETAAPEAGPVKKDVATTSTVRPVKNVERAEPVKEKHKKPSENEKKQSKNHREDSKRRGGKINLSKALRSSEEGERVRSLASIRRARAKAKRGHGDSSSKGQEKMVRDVIVPEVITVQELSNRMAERVFDVTKCLMKMGLMITANQTIDADTAELVVEEFGHNIRRVTEADVEDVLKEIDVEVEEHSEARAPVVTFMGHVDHGKTSLLDAIRDAKVASGEAGGITQHIGAYQVDVRDDQKVTFLDTPGHEAFTEMRKRGATATDIVVLVVAADDGIMAQTIEAINHAKAAEVPIIVAINKIDKPGADAQKVRTSLLSHELVTEDMGGDVMAVEVSAKQGTNLDGLLDAILLQSEVLELQADTKKRATGVVVESRVDKSKGVIATFLVQTGTLQIGDIVVAGESVGKVRAMKNSKGRPQNEAAPSVPVEVMGLGEAPGAGSIFNVVATDKQAREIQEYRKKRSRDLRSAAKKGGMTLEEMFLQSKDGGQKYLPVLIKGDVQGSVEAIIGSLDKIGTDEVAIKVLHKAVGGITTSDISLAEASGALVFGFNVRADSAAKEMAVRDNVDIRYYSIIYDLIDDAKAVLGGMLAPVIRENYIGSAEIREIFNMSKYGKVAGAFVTDGMIKRGAGVRLLRDNVVMHEGKLKTLRRFKDDVKEVASNFECGIAFENYENIKAGDSLEVFEFVEEIRTL